MQLKTLIIIGIIPLVSSCSVMKPRVSTEIKNDARTQYQSNYKGTDANEIAYFVSDDFVNEALNGYTIAKLSNSYSFLNTNHEPVINIHDPAIIDTIFTFYNAKNKIEVYRSKHRDFIFTFDVTSSELSLQGNIKPQMRKSTFFQNFQITQTKSDTIEIANTEGTMKFLFSFKKNQLKRITGILYID